MDRILLLSHQRSGTGTYCDSFNFYHSKNNKFYVPCINEVYTEQYKKYTKFVEKYNLNVDKLKNKDKKELTKSFLCALNSKVFILKYFPLAIKKFCSPKLSLNYIIDTCLANKVSVHFMYRKNILNSTISLLISNFTNIWHKDKKIEKKIDYNKILFSTEYLNEIINLYMNEIKTCFEYYYVFKTHNLIKKELTFENNIINNNFKYSEYLPDYYGKLNNEDDINVVLKNNKEIYSVLNKYLKLYNIKCSERYILQDVYSK